jgi:hypothetical protein
VSKLNKALILEELQKRAAKPKEKIFKVEDYCFDKQLAFIRNPSKFKTAVCSRRAGKTEACAADLLDTALNFPHVTCLYITLSRTSAERIIWRTLLKLLADFEIPHKVNNKELYIKLPNGSDIYVSGAKDKQEVEKFRGMSLKLVYIDECQSFKSYIKELVEDVLSWATKDVAGTICLIGTPGPVPAGYFFEQSHNPMNTNFKWTINDNPWIERKSGMKVADILAHERARKGITESDPTYMREALGLWVKDENALVYRFDKRINIYDRLPDRLNYIFGIDIGFDDADAIAVLGYNLTDSHVYLVQEVITRKQNVTKLIEQIQKLQAKYKPIKMVMDAGALGKKIQDEIRTRHSIPVETAAKERKLEFIELLNDDLRTGRFLAFKGSEFENDSDKIVWDFEGSQKKVSDRTHTDIGDAILYAWRECKHFFPKDEPAQIPDKNSNAYMDAIEEKLAEASRKSEEPDADAWGVDDDDMAAVFDIYDTNGFDDY